MAGENKTHLATLYVTDDQNKHRQILKVWQSPEGFLFTTFSDGNREAGVPSLQVKRSSYLAYTYHPSETVYTGVTVGNVHTGGFHRNEASYSEGKQSSDRGYIQVSARCDKFLLTKVSIPQEIQNRFRRDREFQALVSRGEILCMKASDSGRDAIHSAMTGREDTWTAVGLLSMAQDKKYLEYDHCSRIVRLLKRIIKGEFPPTAEELYIRAAELEKATDSYSLEQAMEDFRSLGYYRDAPARAAALKSRLEEAREREALQADRSRDKGKRIFILVVALGMILMVLAALVL